MSSPHPASVRGVKAAHSLLTPCRPLTSPARAHSVSKIWSCLSLLNVSKVQPLVGLLVLWDTCPVPLPVSFLEAFNVGFSHGSGARQERRTRYDPREPGAKATQKAA